MGNSIDDNYIDALNCRIEYECQQHPIRFKIKLVLLMLLGYVLIFSLCFIPALVGIVVFQVILTLVTGAPLELSFQAFNNAVLIMLLLISFHLNPFKKLYKNEGYELTAQEFPALFAEIDQLSQQKKSPRIHNIILDHSSTAYAIKMPLFTFLGWNKNTLSIGMSYLLWLSPEQMRAVIAHEWGHFSNKDEGYSVRIQLLLMYMRGFCSLVQDYNLGRLDDYMAWYLICLNQYYVVLRRANEVRADAVALDKTGKEVSMETLLKTHVFSFLLDERYWQPLFDLTRILPEPVTAPYSDLQAFLKEYQFMPSELDGAIKQVLSQKSAPLHTHPSLAERLSAFEAAPIMPPAMQISAADAWLGEKLDQVLTDMDAEWHHKFLSVWGKDHQNHQKAAD